MYHLAPDGALATLVPKRRGVGGIALHAEGGVVCSGRDLIHVRFQTTNVPVGASWASDPLGTVSEYLRAGRELPSEKK